MLDNPWYAAISAVAGYVLLTRLYNWIICPEVYGRHAFKKGGYEQGSFRRKQLDRIRVEGGQFPKPFPNGWYRAADSHEVIVGKVLTLSALGREFVVFRGEDGKVGVIDAFCPHLGTHLGHGGVVKGNSIVCPYHLWEFDCDGRNKNIPYCKKDMTGTPRVNTKSYHTVESKELGTIMFWYHADGLEPQWELHKGMKEIEEYTKDGSMRRIGTAAWDDMMLHVFEPSQNSADYFHFQTVHQYLPFPGNLKLVKAAHVISTVYGGAGSEIEKEAMMIREKIDCLTLFGIEWLRIPQFIAESITTFVHIQGPQNIVFKVDTIFGRFRAHFAMLPLEPFRQKATITMYADKSIPGPVARLLRWWIQETVLQDMQVWEHKIHIAPRNLVLGDGPFAQYGKWIDQFYSESSVGWGTIKQSLDW